MAEKRLEVSMSISETWIMISYTLMIIYPSTYIQIIYVESICINVSSSDVRALKQHKTKFIFQISKSVNTNLFYIEKTFFEENWWLDNIYYHNYVLWCSNWF